MTSPQEQFTELTRRTQEGFKNLWQQWSEKGSELMKGVTGRGNQRQRPSATRRRLSMPCSTSPRI